MRILPIVLTSLLHHSPSNNQLGSFPQLARLLWKLELLECLNESETFGVASRIT